MEYKKCENIEDCDVVCTNCFFIFGKGVLKEYGQPKCKHPICADCFRIIYLGEEYPLVAEWLLKINIWYPLRDTLYKELSTGKCCICRFENN